MADLTDTEKKCLGEALDFIKQTADRYSLRQSVLEVSPTDRSVAASVLVGNIAHDKYAACVAKTDIGRH